MNNKKENNQNISQEKLDWFHKNFSKPVSGVIPGLKGEYDPKKHKDVCAPLERLKNQIKENE